MKQKLVWVETNAQGLAIRIFRSASAAGRHPDNFQYIVRMPRSEAVSQIRHQLWLRCKGQCELCGDTVIEISGHMHETKHRGKGGEVSLANSVFVCPRTHVLEHKDRNPRWSKKLK